MTFRPSNSTGVNGDPGTGGGSTGWTSAVTLTLTVSFLVPSCGSTTSITHSGSPVSLSTCWTTTSPLDLSKSRTFSNVPTAYAPAGNTVPTSTENGPRSGIATPLTLVVLSQTGTLSNTVLRQCSLYQY